LNFPHLLWGLTNWGPHYKLARAIGCSESRLSRCLYGRSPFTDGERAAIARVLGLSELWLFEDVELPARKPSDELFAEGTA
jgi:transcriptional regulator with XRE-family HTH domain